MTVYYNTLFVDVLDTNYFLVSIKTGIGTNANLELRDKLYWFNLNLDALDLEDR